MHPSDKTDPAGLCLEKMSGFKRFLGNDGNSSADVLHCIYTVVCYSENLLSRRLIIIIIIIIILAH